MCAVILIFAFAMSLVINLIERMIVHHNKVNKEQETEEVLAVREKE